MTPSVSDFVLEDFWLLLLFEVQVCSGSGSFKDLPKHLKCVEAWIQTRKSQNHDPGLLFRIKTKLYLLDGLMLMVSERLLQTEEYLRDHQTKIQGFFYPEEDFL